MSGKWVEVDYYEYTKAIRGGKRRRATYGQGTTFEVWQEDLPLPAEPGVRFWGKIKGNEPEWWFTYRSLSSDRRVHFVSAGGAVSFAGTYLTRLPDPPSVA